jgi:ArsR family transcriptional regulator, arsenate/arsenite/antimonite-responsive transcriptional repressor
MTENAVLRLFAVNQNTILFHRMQVGQALLFRDLFMQQMNAFKKKLTQRGRWTILPLSNLGGTAVKAFLKVMKALSDPNRVKIIKMLQQRVMCVCELKAALNVAQPTVSKHLKLLEEAGLVSSEKDGLWVNYHLTDGSSSPYAATILGNLRHWLNDERQIMDLVKKLPSIRREDVCKK